MKRSSKPTAKPLWRSALIIGVVLLPLLLLIMLLIRHAVNVPFWDQWELPGLYEKIHNGTLGFSDFFAQHNEHRILFPRLIMAGLAVLTGWNVLYEVAVNVVLAAASFWFLWLLLKRTFDGHKKILFAAVFSVSLVVFSPIQFENWMWGWQIQWYLNVLGLVVAVWALWGWREARPALRWVVAAVAASVATYSLASGFFVWLVCLPLLWFVKDMRQCFWWWVGAGALVVASHYIGYVDPAYHPSKLIFLKEPLQFAVYFLVYVGRPVVVDFLISVPVALAYLTMLALSLWHVFRQHTRELTTSLLPWLCLGLYGLAAAASTSLSRLGLGVEQAYSNRYITLSGLLLLAVIVVLFKIVQLSPGNALRMVRTGAVGLLAVIVLLVGLNYVKGAAQMREREIHLLKVQHCARTATSAEDECLLLLYPSKEVVWPRLEYLRSIHWGGL